MLIILNPGKQEGIYFPDPANPMDFRSIGKIPVWPETAVKADIIQQVVKKNLPPFEIITEGERVIVIISGDPITVTEDGYDEHNELDEEGNVGKPPILSCGTALVLFPYTRYAFQKSSGTTFLSFVWQSHF